MNFTNQQHMKTIIFLIAAIIFMGCEENIATRQHDWALMEVTARTAPERDLPDGIHQGAGKVYHECSFCGVVRINNALYYSGHTLTTDEPICLTQAR